MTDRSTFETRLEARLMSRASIASRPFDAARIAQTAARAGRERGRSSWRDWSWLGARTSRPVIVLLFVALLLAIAAAVLVGTSLLRHPQRLPGAIVPTGQMAIPRAASANAVLDDGRVLFAGGTAQGQDSDPVQGEVFDPATSLFSETQPMVQARSSASATTLHDGRVLVAGGSAANSGGGLSMSTAELFDPRTGSFAPTGAMHDPRFGQAAAVLADGRVLVAGGRLADRSGASADLATAEVYDPTSGTWSTAGPMPAGRSEVGGNGQGMATATLLPDGRVLVAGGLGAGGPLASAVLFDPRTNTFVETGSMTFARSQASATLLPDGRVLIVGGDATRSQSPAQVQALSSAELFDPESGTFSPTGSLNTERSGHSATLLPDGRVLIAGGTNVFGQPLSSELYDPASGTFGPGPTASSAHAEFAALLPDGRVLLAGDRPEVFDVNASAVTPASPTPRSDRTFSRTGEPIESRRDHSATRLLDGRVLIVGGDTPDGSVLASAELYDPRSGTFAPTGSMATARLAQTALLLRDGRVLIVGGFSNETASPTARSAVEAYDPRSGRFADAGPLAIDDSQKVDGITAVKTPAGQVLVLVAYASLAVGRTSQDTAVYNFDPDARTSVHVATLSDCSIATGDAALPDGRVMFWCFDPSGQLELSLYDPTARRLVSSGPSDMYGTVVNLPGGRVAIYDAGTTNRVEIFDPSSGRSTQLDSLPSENGATTATLLADGRVLFIEGTQVDRLDPRTGHFTRLAQTLADLSGQSTTLLDDGRVLIVGGTIRQPDRGTPLPPEAELFDPAAAP